MKNTDEKMTIEERMKYLRKMQKRYKKAGKKEQGKLLKEMEAVTELHRKSLIRLMGGPIVRKRRMKQRGSIYGPEVDDALRVIAESLDYLCAERLQPSLSWMAEHLSKHGEMEVNERLLDQLERISVSTVQRRMKYIRRDERRLPQKGPEHTNRLLREIPAGRIAWDEPQPGHFEVDLVHHCGMSSSSMYVHTLQLIDVNTGWSERVAVLGRSYRVMEDAFERVIYRLPFNIAELHPDNGSEFINDHLLHFWKDKVKGIQISRSRAWHKNDNRFVEQKNDTLVRAYIGHDRLDTVEQTNLLNQLYDHMWLYYNFFQPVMRLKEKISLPANGKHRHIRHRFDKALSPFERLCKTNALDPDIIAKLHSLRNNINPRQLRNEIYDLLDQLFSLPCAKDGQAQDVFLTIGLWKSGQQKDAVHFSTVSTKANNAIFIEKFQRKEVPLR